MYPDAYAHLYQKMEGFKIKILAPNNRLLQGYLSANPSTRSTYDLAMKDATIDGLITMDEIDKLKPSQIFFKENNPSELFILQAVNEFEFQKYTRNISAIKQNCYITVKRKGYNEETSEEEYLSIYEDLIGFVSITNKDEKNFAAGVEDSTNVNIQIPKRDVAGTINIVENQDRIILSNVNKDYLKEVKIESIDAFGVPGVIRIYGTFDTRSGD